MSKVIKITDATDLVPTSNYPYGKWDFSHFNPIQSKLMEIYDKDCNVVIASATASGKAQPLTSKILSPNGFVEMGNVKVGDEILSHTGDIAKITGVFPQGKKPIYRVVFSDSSSTSCCEDHLWLARNNDRFFRLMSLKKIIRFGEFNYWQIPLVQEKEIFPESAYSEERYFTKIELIGEQECQCISVDTQTHLYITDDYILTHNTISSELFLAYEIRKNKGKGIYVGPLKSLAKEKQEDWTISSHHFSDLKTFIATGDFRFTEKRSKEMDESSLVVMTPEMLSSRARNYKSEKSRFLYETNVIIWDEFHLIGVPKRGDHCEVALMKLIEINPNARMIALSATMPNVDEICGWLAEVTGRDTYYLESSYRPCPLNVHYETYYDGDRDYDSKELSKIGMACAIVEHYPDDKFLVFVHTKRTGQKMVEALARYGVNAEFHYADLTLKKRLDLENRFKTDKDFRVLVATSTVAWGCNLPARRVVITGIHRGLQEVENYDLGQMCVEENSKIMMAFGIEYYKKAKDVVVGDKVIGVDSNNKFTKGTVTKIFSSKETARKFTLSNGKEVVFNNHPILDRENNWKNSNDLKVGDEIISIQTLSFLFGKVNKSDYVRIDSIEEVEDCFLVNFSVDDCETFIVDDIVTHNCGRAGRPKYDPRGDAYILVPESEKDYWVRKLRKPTLIRSTLLEYVGKETDPHYKILAFHVVSEIHQGTIKTKEGFHKWFKKSLAYYQGHFFDDQVIDNTLSLLIECKAVTIRDNEYECTSIGKIASMFYYSPFDVSDLKRNFSELFNNNKDNDDFAISIALANIDTHRWGIVNKWEKEAISGYISRIEKMFGCGKFTDSCMKVGCVYHNMLKGKYDVPVLQAITGTLLLDLDRTIQVLNAVDGMSSKWDRLNWFKNLNLRVKYGVEPDLVELCQIPNVGGARAKRLKSVRIKSLEEFVSYDANTLAKIMKCSLKLVNEAIDGAKEIILKESME